jgi:hypothetical protein
MLRPYRWPLLVGASALAALGAGTLAGCAVERRVTTESHFEAFGADGRPLTAARVAFLAADGAELASGAWGEEAAVDSEEPLPTGGWGRRARLVEIGASGHRPARRLVHPEHQRYRFPVGGHPSWRFEIEDRYRLQTRVLLAPMVDAAGEARALAELATGTRPERARAALALGGFHPAPEEPVADHLVDGALAALDRMAPAPEQFATWLEELGGGERFRWHAAALVLGEHSAPRQREAFQWARRRLDEPGARGTAALLLLGELTRLGELEEERSAALVAALGAADPERRELAALGLARLPRRLGTEVLRAVERCVGDPDPRVRRAVAHALAERGPR